MVQNISMNKNTLLNISISSGSFLVYVLLFYFFEHLGSIWLSALVLIPVTTLAFQYGLKGGLILGILAWPLSRLLFLLFDRTPMTALIDVVMGWSVSIFFGALIGYLRDLTLKYKGTSEKLEKAMSEVKRLSGLLPICAHCKNIRNDQGYWEKVEDYLSSHSEAEFSHSLCPDCMKKYYPELTTQEEEPDPQ
jgi:thiamine transporter ThiT